MQDISLELKVKNGDFDILSDNETSQQTQNIIIVSDKGNIINNVLLGVGIQKYISGPIDILSIRKKIFDEFSKENLKIKTIEIKNGELCITVWSK